MDFINARKLLTSSLSREAPDAHDVRGEDFRAKNYFFRLDNAAAGDSGRGMTMGESAGKRRCKSAKASGLPTKNRSARPELQNAIGPTLQERPFEPPFETQGKQGKKGGAPEKAKSKFVGRGRGRRPARNEDGRTDSESEESCRVWRLASGPQVRHFTMLTGFRLMTTSLF